MTEQPDKHVPIGNVVYGSGGAGGWTSTGAHVSVIPQVRDREYLCPCGGKLTRKRLATKAKKVGRYYEVIDEKAALHCAKCGPVAWEA